MNIILVSRCWILMPPINPLFYHSAPLTERWDFNSARYIGCFKGSRIVAYYILPLLCSIRTLFSKVFWEKWKSFNGIYGKIYAKDGWVFSDSELCGHFPLQWRQFLISLYISFFFTFLFSRLPTISLSFSPQALSFSPHGQFLDPSRLQEELFSRSLSSSSSLYLEDGWSRLPEACCLNCSGSIYLFRPC